MNIKDLSLVLLRVGLGVLFFYAGWTKVTASEPWTAAGYLKGAAGPLAETFKGLAANSTIDMLVMMGLTLGGLALILGIFTRLAAIGLAALMALIYLSHFPPAAPNWYVDDHIIYIAGLAVVAAFGAGRVWGLGKWAGKYSPWLV